MRVVAITPVSTAHLNHVLRSHEYMSWMYSIHKTWIPTLTSVFKGYIQCNELLYLRIAIFYFKNYFKLYRVTSTQLGSTPSPSLLLQQTQMQPWSLQQQLIDSSSPLTSSQSL